MRRPTAITTAVLAVLALGTPVARAQTVELKQFGGQAFAGPYYVTGPPGDPSRVFVVEGGGAIELVKNGVTLPTPFLDISADVQTGGESGLFSMAFAPDYATSGLFYVFYTRDDPTPGNEHYLRIEEFKRSDADPDVADPASRRIVLEIPHLQAGNHNGGQLQFGPDKLLYISTGDGGSGFDTFQNGQNLGAQLGKILRIDPAGDAPFEYSIPADNPFADGPGGNADEIYSYGLRNPWRFSFDLATGDIAIGDVGQAAWEEVDFAPRGGARGLNFGWGCFEGNHPQTNPPAYCTPPPTNATPPVLEYANPPGAPPAAVVGGYVIRDGALPSLLGRYVYADTYNALGGQLRTAVLAPGGASGDAALGPTVANPVSFGQDACGHIYVATVGTNFVYRLEPTSGSFPCAPVTSVPAAPKPAPAPTLVAKVGRRALKAGGIVVKARCDRNCEFGADAVVRIRKPGTDRRLRADASPTATLRADQPQTFTLKLSKNQLGTLRDALDARRRAIALVQMQARGTGAAGGVTKSRVRVRLKG